MTGYRFLLILCGAYLNLFMLLAFTYYLTKRVNQLGFYYT